VKYLSAILVLLVALVRADTLDFARQTIVVTALQQESGPIAVGDDYPGRALSVLRAATFDRDLMVGSFLAAHAKSAARLERMTLESQRGETKYLSDGSVSTDYLFPITATMREQLQPDREEIKLLGRRACPCCGQPWPEGRDVPAGLTLVPYEDANAPVYSGILVDARGLSLKPALFPRLVTEDDDQAYGPDFADPKELPRAGLVAYYASRTEALASERVGGDPLVIRAIARAGSNDCDAVISGYDASRLHGTKADLALLAKCKVGFLLD